MKQSGCLSKVVTYAATLACVAFVSSTQAVEMGKAVVRAIQGSAQHSDGATWLPLHVGQVLRPGTTIRTANDSRVDLFLDDNGPIVRLLENTTLGLDKLNYDVTGVDIVVETVLDVKSGKIVGIVKKLSPASKYEVKTPNGVAGVRESAEYVASATEELWVVNGSVVKVTVKNDGRVSTKVVSAGEKYSPGSDSVPPIPQNELTQALAEVNSLRGISKGADAYGSDAIGGVATSTTSQLAAGANNQIGKSQVPIISIGFNAGDDSSRYQSPVD